MKIRFGFFKDDAHDALQIEIRTSVALLDSIDGETDAASPQAVHRKRVRNLREFSHAIVRTQ